MRKLIIRGFWLVTFLAAGYAASPFLSAMMLHAAIKRGWSGYVERQVEWETVRASVKESIGDLMAEQALTRPIDAGFIQNIKYKVADYVSPWVIDYTIDNRVTPEGFIEHMAPTPEELAAKERALQAGLMPLPSPGIISRIKRMKFVGLTEFEINLKDKRDPAREYLATFALRRFGWMLSRVQVLSLGKQR